MVDAIIEQLLPVNSLGTVMVMQNCAFIRMLIKMCPALIIFVMDFKGNKRAPLRERTD